MKANEIAPQLVQYMHEQGFTHVEFLPVYEHPLDDSWGYMGTGYYAATARFGVPKDFMYLVDEMHKNGYITKEECEQAKLADLELRKNPSTILSTTEIVEKENTVLSSSLTSPCSIIISTRLSILS